MISYDIIIDEAAGYPIDALTAAPDVPRFTFKDNCKLRVWFATVDQNNRITYQQAPAGWSVAWSAYSNDNKELTAAVTLAEQQSGKDIWYEAAVSFDGANLQSAFGYNFNSVKTIQANGFLAITAGASARTYKFAVVFDSNP